MPWGRRIGLIALALAVVAGVAYGFRPQPVVVELVAAYRGPLEMTVEEEGKTRVIDRFVVSAPVPGFARRIEFKVGDAVAAGQVLVNLEPLRSTVLDPRSRAEAEARLAAVQAALHSAEEAARAADAQADLAEAERVRMTDLYEVGDVSRKILDQAETEARRARATCKSAEFSVEVAQYEVQAAGTALRYSAAENPAGPMETVTLRAPVAGNVLRVYDTSERVVGAGTPLIEIGDPRALEVEVDVLSADAVRIRPGMRVVYRRWGGGPPLDGRVRVVEPVGFTKVSALGVEEQRVLVIADIVSPREAWERLGDNYRVETSFVLWESDDVLQIPASALFRDGDDWAVFTVNDGHAQRRTVEIGHQSGLRAEVLSGLHPAELVIPHPDDAIADGVRLVPRAND